MAIHLNRPLGISQPLGASTPLTSALNGRENLERQFLSAGDSGQTLQILYEARGHQIQRLQEELASYKQGQDQDLRSLNHELALLKGDKATLESTVQHLKAAADGQVEENRQLRDELDGLQRKLDLLQKAKATISKELESSNLMIQTLQSQVTDLQSSDTLIKAKHQHDQVVKSLRERHEVETFHLQQELERLQAKIQSKENEVDVLRSKVARSQRDHDVLLVEKSETIKNLQHRLDQTQKQLGEYLSDKSAQTDSNVRAMHKKAQEDQEKYANDIIGFSDEIKDLEAKLRSKEECLADTLKRLDEITTKYQALKSKARQYQAHSKRKEERYLQQIQTGEEELKEKLTVLKSRMEDAYNHKEKQIETELLDMKKKFNEELARALRIDTENELSIYESSTRSPPPRKPLASHENLQQRTSSEDLHRIFQNAKISGVGRELKRPSDK